MPVKTGLLHFSPDNSPLTLCGYEFPLPADHGAVTHIEEFPDVTCQACVQRDPRARSISMPGTTNMRIKVDIPLESDFLSDILICAFDGNYGGAWYWCEPRVPANRESWLSYRDTDHGVEWTKVTILETSDGEVSIPHDVTWETVAAGLNHVIEAARAGDQFPTTLAAIIGGDAGDIDSTAADMIVQMGLFDGEVRYG